MPRSLKLPVWLLPHSFIHRSSRPTECPYRFAQNRLVPPSSRLTTLLSSSSGATHSFLPHTPLPYGQAVRLYRSSNNLIQPDGLRARNAARSCATSSRPPHVGQR